MLDAEKVYMNHNLVTESRFDILNKTINDAIDAGIMVPPSAMPQANSWIGQLFDVLGDTLYFDSGLEPNPYYPFYTAWDGMSRYKRLISVGLSAAEDVILPDDGVQYGYKFVRKPDVWSGIVHSVLTKKHAATYETLESEQAFNSVESLLSFIDDIGQQLRNSQILTEKRMFEDSIISNAITSALSGGVDQKVTVAPITDEATATQFLNDIRTATDALYLGGSTFNPLNRYVSTDYPLQVLLIDYRDISRIRSLVRNSFDKDYPVAVIPVKQWGSFIPYAAGVQLYPIYNVPMGKPTGTYSTTEGGTTSTDVTTWYNPFSDVHAILLDARFPIFDKAPDRTKTDLDDFETGLNSIRAISKYRVGYNAMAPCIIFRDSNTPTPPTP